MKELEALKANPQFVTLYTKGMQSLKDSGVFNVIRQLGFCQFGASSTIDEVALRGAWSKGFQDAIDTLYNFLEYHIDPKTGTNQLRMDFGSVEYALKQGLITEEEANVIRNSKRTS